MGVDIDEHSDVGPEIEAKISAEELQDLLRFAIVEQHFFEFDSETAQRELDAEQAKTGLRMAVHDGVLTVIRIRTAERDHKGEFYALYDYVTAFPTLKPLLNLHAIEDRLLRLFHEINAGGKESIGNVNFKRTNIYKGHIRTFHLSCWKISSTSITHLMGERCVLSHGQLCASSQTMKTGLGN